MKSGDRRSVRSHRLAPGCRTRAAFAERVCSTVGTECGRSESVIAGTNRGLGVRTGARRPGLCCRAHHQPGVSHDQSELRSGLKLDYPQNSLLLDVTAISSRTFPEQFQYAFTLSDSSGKVIREKLSHDSQFAMEKLKAGTYKVTARAFTKDLTPATPLSFEFTVARAPFPWTSTRARRAVVVRFDCPGLGLFSEPADSSQPAPRWLRQIASWPMRVYNWRMKPKLNAVGSRAICTTRHSRI